MYSKEQIQKIRQLINSHFERGDVYEKLKSKVESENIRLEDLDNDKLTKLLRDTNLIDNLMLDMKHLEEIDDYNQRNKQLTYVDPDKLNSRSVTLRIYKGKAFLDLEDKKQFFQIYLSFCGQRYKSAPVEASAEPDFNELFVFDLKGESAKANVDLLTLSKVEHPIEMSLILIDEKTSERKLYSQKLIEWRFLLCYGNISLNIEMPTCYNTRMKEGVRQFAGILQIHLELLPKTGLVLLPETVLTQQLSREKASLNTIADRFHTYSSAWWNDYKELKLPLRPIKLYAECQDGIWRPSCTFIRPLICVRGINSPNHAARFVSLIPFKRTIKAQDERQEIWHRFSTFLALKSSDCEDHCFLLASLFLGLNLETYVVFGTASDGPHSWIMTRLQKPKKPNQKSFEYVYHFWESLTGHRFDLTDPKVPQLYKRVGCIFNHKTFYANIQPNDAVTLTDLNVDDYTKWKAIDPVEINNLKSQNFQLTLLRPTLFPDDLEPKLESQLKEALGSYRKILNLATRFDDKLASIMQIALANYELEKITGAQFAQQEFQSAIRSYIPEGHTFKSFPISFTHMNIEKMLEDIKQAPVGGEIASARGDQTYFALRVKMELYPEDIYAIWVSISVRFHSIN